MKQYNLDNISNSINDCVEQLKQPGSVILVPTETVYGLVCDWQDQTAIERIYHLKQRDQNKPLALFVDSLAMLEEHRIVIPENARKLTDNFCPGPITIVIPGAGGKTIGFRIPDHPFMLALLKQYRHPLASTSANSSGMPNALTVTEAVDMLIGQPDIAINHGSLPPHACASTVVMVNNDQVEIIRNGLITAEEICAIIKKRP